MAQLAVDALNRWLLTEGRRHDTVAGLLDALAPHLEAVLPLDRIWAGTRVFHPQAEAYAWTREQGQPTRTFELSYERYARLDAVDSPLQRLRLGAPFVRFDCTGPDPTDPADVHRLGEQGYTDLYGRSLHFREEWVGGFTWTTRTPGGFTDDHIAVLDGIHPVLSAVLEPLARDMVLATLLRAYLGTDAGTRVAAGQVRRGDHQTLTAAVWFSDVRGFTNLSETLPRDALLSLLDDVFEAIADTLAEHGGQVLKFIGDGVLGVFVAEPGPDGQRDACVLATAAADAVQTRLAALRDQRRARDEPTADVGIGLHVGEVTYGNIGAPGRLDFTVIGPAVNRAARIEGLCSTLGQPLLASAAFADHVPGWEPLGEHAMKGIAAPVRVCFRAS